MANKYTLANIAREAAGGSRLMQGREKIATEDIINETLTLRDCDKVSAIDADGTVSEYYVVVFDEYPDNYYSGGQQLTKICTAIEANGLINELNANGLKIELTRKKTAAGRRFTAVAIKE